MGQKVCSIPCSIEEAKRSRARKAKLKIPPTRSTLKARAQRAFNRYIRVRDANKPCITCGTMTVPDHLTGSGWHCGHFRTVKAAGHLRFHPLNATKQCAKCNNHESGARDVYRVNLGHRIGADRVERLENDNRTRKWTDDELLRIANVYNARANLYERKFR